MRISVTFLACLVAAGPLAGCVESRTSQPNILIVMIDTLRFDRLAAYGNDQNLTPFLDSLAARGHAFRRAYAQSSWTNPSIASLFTSRYQSQHHVVSFGSVLSADELTLSEILRQRGYTTGAFCANILVAGRLGFDQGFDYFKNVARAGDPDGFPRLRKGRADALNQQALEWLDAVRGAGQQAPPVFLYLHYMEPHAPFDPPEEFVTKVLNGRPRPDLEKVNDHMNVVVSNFSDELLRAAEDFYDAEIMSLDAQLQALFAKLQSRGFLADTIVVLVADHGEELKEHGLVGHHQTLYEEVIRIPFLLLVPGQTQHAEIPDVVSLVDVAPTLLDLAGLPPSETFEGRSLTSLMGVGPDRWWSKLRRLFAKEGPRPAFSELVKAEGTLRQSPHERAVVLEQDKLIVDVDGEREYYDLAADPGERNPTATSERSALDSAMQQLYAYGAERGTPGKGSLDAETRERMRALGYDE